MRQVGNMLKHNIIHYCINNRLFTSGSPRQYESMLDYAAEHTDKIRDVAVMIWICSKTDKTIDEIEKDLGGIYEIR